MSKQFKEIEFLCLPLVGLQTIRFVWEPRLTYASRKGKKDNTAIS